MSEILTKAVAVINAKLGDTPFTGSVKFVLEGEGSILVDAEGARISDAPAEVTLSAKADLFRGIFEGRVKPASAFMSGKLSVEGSMTKAMQLAQLIA